MEEKRLFDVMVENTKSMEKIVQFPTRSNMIDCFAKTEEEKKKIEE